MSASLKLNAVLTIPPGERGERPLLKLSSFSNCTNKCSIWNPKCAPSHRRQIFQLTKLFSATVEIRLRLAVEEGRAEVLISRSEMTTCGRGLLLGVLLGVTETADRSELRMGSWRMRLPAEKTA